MKFSKVMFSQVSVCPQGGFGLCPRGKSPSQGFSLQGVSVQGSLSRGVSVMEAPHTVISMQYASYWNVFLFFLSFLYDLVTFVRQHAEMLKQKSATIEELSANVERQSTLIQQMRKEHRHEIQVIYFLWP